MSRKSTTLQLDLFSCQHDSWVTQTSRWDTLPAHFWGCRLPLRRTAMLASLVSEFLNGYGFTASAAITNGTNATSFRCYGEQEIRRGNYSTRCREFRALFEDKPEHSAIISVRIFVVT